MRCLLLTDFATHRAGAVLDDASGDPIAQLARDGASLVPSTPSLEGAARRIRDANRGHFPEDLGELFAAVAGPAALPVDGDGVARVYVSPTGDDANHGLAAADPFATIAAALARVDRASRAGQEEPVEVVLAAGTHDLAEVQLRLAVPPLTSVTLVGPTAGLAVAATGGASGGDFWTVEDAGAGWAPNAFDSYALEVFDPGDPDATRQLRTVRSNGAEALAPTRAFDVEPDAGWTYVVRVPAAVVTLTAPALSDLWADVDARRVGTSRVRVVIAP